MNSLVSSSVLTFNMNIEENEENTHTLDHGKTTVNQYATKKTLAISNLEVALLATNAVQLKTLLGNTTERKILFWLDWFNPCLCIVSLFNF